MPVKLPSYIVPKDLEQAVLQEDDVTNIYPELNQVSHLFTVEMNKLQPGYWFMLGFSPISNPLILHCDHFDRGSAQELV